MPAPAQLFAFEAEVEMALGQTFVRLALGKPVPAIPDHHRAAAIFALRDGALERVVFDGMILGLNRKALLAGDEAGTAGDRPALHHAIELEPEIIVQATRRVLLNDKSISFRARGSPARLRRHIELAFLVVKLKTHGLENCRAGKGALSCAVPTITGRPRGQKQTSVRSLRKLDCAARGRASIN